MKIRERVFTLKYPNFYWAVTWAITNVCNLRCSYCIVPPAKEHPDFEIAIAKLLKMKPKHLCINGGEPTLVPDVVGILKRLRAGIDRNLQIEFNTNGTLPERVFDILPHINNLCLSIDGVGEVNEWQRGYDGDKLLALLEELVQYRPGDGQRFRILVVPVATQLSYERLPALIERVQDIWGKGRVDVSMEIKPVHPYDHPMTLANKPDFWRDFMEKGNEWMKRYDLPITVRGLSTGSGCDTDEGAKKASQCIRQFFSCWVEWNGQVAECKPVRYYEYLRDRYMNGDLREKMTAAWRAVDSLLVRRRNTTCYAPCDHAEFLDDILLSGRASEIDSKAKAAGLSISREEIAGACLFIRKHFNRDLVLDVEPAGPCLV